MSLISSRQTKVKKWRRGDLIGALEAAQLLGYKSAKQMQDASRRESIIKDFEAVGCSLTVGIWIGGQMRFLRSEIEEFLTRKVENAREMNRKRRRDLLQMEV